MLSKLWNVEKEKIEKQSVFWNILSSGLNSIVSMLLLWVVTFANGVSDAGIFTLGFSTAQMMLTIGNYGMRNYQVSDVKKKYSTSLYLASRVLTCCSMMIITFGFVVIKGYYLEKALITIFLCLLKITDAFDDVFGGAFQREGRLDISGKIMSMRIGMYVVGFTVSLFVCRSLIFSCFVAVIISTAVLVILIRSTQKTFVVRAPKFEWKKIGALLNECFPLCISAFLLIYMGNAPKYAIDVYLTAEDQAYYTYLFMPCFVTNLFVGFVLQPLLVKLARYWNDKIYIKFVKMCMVIFMGALAAAIVIIFAGALAGVPLLSLVFAVELEAYKDVLVILLIGGAFFAFAVLEQIILTVMRRQKILMAGFACSSIVAGIISSPLVKNEGLMGAGVAYTVSAFSLFIILALVILFALYKEKKSDCRPDLK